MRVFSTLSVAVGLFCSVSISANAYEVAPVSSGGKIKGTIIFNGEPPTRTVIPTKDQDVCGQARKDPIVRVGANKGVHEAVVVIQGIAKGKAWPAAGKKPQLDNKSCRFIPGVQVMQAGAIDIVNSDPVLHNTHGYYGRRTAFNLALPNQGQRIEVELKRPGAVMVDCDAHGWMLGWVYVVDNPYYALTDENGAFEIADIPAGKYTLTINQEHVGSITREVEVKAGETLDVPPIELKK
jgi:plastocyanin